MYKTLLILHILSATVWTGGHLVLAIGFLPQALKRKDPAIIEVFESRFERIGIPALVIQVLTGLWLANRYLPMAQWFSFENYLSTHIVIKLVLLGLTLVLAMDARLRLIPKLDASRLVSLAAHILAVTLISVLFVIVGIGIRTGGLF